MLISRGLIGQQAASSCYGSVQSGFFVLQLCSGKLFSYSCGACNHKKGFSPLKRADWLIMRWIKPQKQPKDFLKHPVLSAHFGRICSVVCCFFTHWTTKDNQGCGSFIKDGVSESWRMTSTIQLSSEQHWQYLFYTSSLQNEQQLGWRRCWLPDVRIFGCKSRHLQCEHVGVFEADEFGQDRE